MRATRALIHTDNLVHNLNIIKEHAKKAGVCAVVKANGYGSSAAIVARVYQKCGVKDFAVATVPEGVALRKDGINGRILLLSPFDASEVEDIVSHNITPCISSVADAEPLNAYFLSYNEQPCRQRHGHRAAQRFDEQANSVGDKVGEDGAGKINTIDVFLAVDTGMGRVGVFPENAANVAKKLHEMVGVRLCGLMTHFSVADSADIADKEFTAKQIAIFKSVADDVAEVGYKSDELILTASASSAFLMGEYSEFGDNQNAGFAAFDNTSIATLSKDFVMLSNSERKIYVFKESEIENMIRVHNVICVTSIDELHILQDCAGKQDKTSDDALDICIGVNILLGVAEIPYSDIIEMAKEIHDSPNFHLDGLIFGGESCNDFKQIRELLAAIKQAGYAEQDFKVGAIEKFIKDDDIEKLGLSAHASDCLKKTNIQTICDILDNTELELAGVLRLDKESIAEIKDKLHKMGLKLGQPSYWSQKIYKLGEYRKQSFALDLVRAGIIMYGLPPSADMVALFASQKIDFRPVLSVVTKVASIKHFAAGSPISYGRTFTTQEECYIAVLPIGYADGLLRRYGEFLQVGIAGKPYPIVGRICMDMCMINLGSNPYNVRVGDEVWVFGDKAKGAIMDATDIATKCGTINYEVTTCISARVPRVAV